MAYLVPLFFHEVSKSNSNIFKQQSLSNKNRESVFGKNVNKIENQTLQSGIICVLFVSCHQVVYIPRFKRIVNAPSECLKSKHDGWIPETCIRMHNVFNIVPFCKTWNYSNDIDHQLVYNRPLIHFFKFQAQGGGGWGGGSILLIYVAK